MIDTKIAVACACGFLKGIKLPPAVVHRDGEDEHMAGYCTVKGKTLPEKHIFDRYMNPRDPHARNQAISFCGKFEECSGSGRHGEYYSRSESDCYRCCRVYDSELGTLDASSF